MDSNTSPKDKNYFNLSPCSKREIYDTISKKGGCFTKETHPVNRPDLSVQMEISSKVNLPIWWIVLPIAIFVGFVFIVLVIKRFCRSKDKEADSGNIA